MILLKEFFINKISSSDLGDANQMKLINTMPNFLKLFFYARCHGKKFKKWLRLPHWGNLVGNGANAPSHNFNPFEIKWLMIWFSQGSSKNRCTWDRKAAAVMSDIFLFSFLFSQNQSWRVFLNNIKQWLSLKTWSSHCWRSVVVYWSSVNCTCVFARIKQLKSVYFLLP